MIGAMLASNATQSDPEATAIVFGKTTLSWPSLNQRVNRAAQLLLSQGVERGDRVAGLMNNCHQFIELFFAAAKIGAVFLPVNFRLAPREIAGVLQRCTPRLLFAGESLREKLATLEADGVLPPQVIPIADYPEATAADGAAYEKLIGAARSEEPDIAVELSEPQLLVHSSGTTGTPKAAVWSGRTTLFSSMAKIIDFGLSPADRTAVFGPLFHVGPLMDLAVPLLLRGGSLVIGATTGFDPASMIATVARERVTVMTIYPTMWRRVLALGDLATYDLSSLRLLFTGGEAIPIPVLDGIYARFPKAGFVNTYGSTEGGPITTFLPPSEGRRKIGSVGRPAFGVELRIVDDNDRPLGPEAIGELVVRSPFVCEGYWNNPAETRLHSRNGWWHTGDLARRDGEGFLWIAGRKKDMIISGAENIYPIEVEQAIAELADVVEVAVVGTPDEAWGEAVVAFVVKRAGSTLDEAAIIEHCRRNLASYKKPRKVVFIDSLPRTTTSKIAKEALRRSLTGQSPAEDGFARPK